jgi:hypothetical protein
LALSRELHGEQELQKFTSLIGTQMPSQSFWPLGHMPLQAMLLGMQAPAHSLVPPGHSEPHLPLVQVALPPSGTGQGEQDSPQLVGLVLSTQRSSHLWKPGLQASSHLSPSQEGTPLGEVGHGVQDEPQAPRLLGATQTPLHRFLPSGHMSAQGSSMGMQAFAHSFWPAGQEAPHSLPSQVALPPAMVVHGSQETPQFSVDMLSTHWPRQLWVPAGQAVGSSGVPGVVGAPGVPGVPGFSGFEGGGVGPSLPRWGPGPGGAASTISSGNPSIRGVTQPTIAAAAASITNFGPERLWIHLMALLPMLLPVGGNFQTREGIPPCRRDRHKRYVFYRFLRNAACAILQCRYFRCRAPNG